MQKKIDPSVKKETSYVLIFSVILSVLMEAVFLIIGKWDITVLLGNLLGLTASVGNFFLMCLTIQSVMSKDEKEIKSRMKVSQMLRMLMMFGFALVGYLVSVFNIYAVVIPYLFPQIGVKIRAFTIKEGE